MDSRPYRAFVALFASALLVLAGLLASGILPLGAPNHPVGAMPVSSEATNNFDQLVVVLMENKNLNEVYGPAPYMTQLADQYSFSEGWSSITNPSQPNYIAIMGASTFGVGGDGNHPNLNHPTLVDLIETSGHTWNAIAEGSGSGCSINPDRGEDHFPFLSYTTITGNAARCANLHSGGPADVVTALNAGTNFIWFTLFPERHAGGNAIDAGGTPGVRHTAQADHSAGSAGSFDGEVEQAGENTISQATRPWSGILQNHRARGELGDASFDRSLQILGPCDGVQPLRHVRQPPHAFEWRPARRGSVVFGEGAGNLFTTEPANSRRVPVNFRNSRRVRRARGEANRDDRGQDRCDPLHHGAVLLMTRSREVASGSGGSDAMVGAADRPVPAGSPRCGRRSGSGEERA